MAFNENHLYYRVLGLSTLSQRMAGGGENGNRLGTPN